MDHFASTVEGYFDDWDFDFYRYAVQQAPNKAHFVEVGSWKGRSTAFMAVEIINSGKDIQFDAVDTFIGSEEQQDDNDVVNKTLFQTFQSNMSPVRGYYNPVVAESTAAAKLYNDNSIDFVFIDASHDYDSVVADIKAWLPKVKPGGMISGHDYPHDPVRRAVADQLTTPIGAQGACWFTIK
jgi:predicted O-methyltransferase YrrM